jgi:hypothetical protein
MSGIATERTEKPEERPERTTGEPILNGRHVLTFLLLKRSHQRLFSIS